MNKLDNSGVFTDPAYRIAKSMYVAVGGDPEAVFGSADEIYAAINDIYDSTGSRINVEGLKLQITENGSYNFDDVEVTGYKPVEIVVDVYQKYTDEQVEQIRQESYQEGNDDGFVDGYAEGLEDGAEDQKALLETITISENGTYTKEDGYNEVIVDIDIPEPPKFNNLVAEIAENGAYVWNAESQGYDGFNDVRIDVNVPTGGGTGFDFSVIGYDKTLENEINSTIANDIAYAKSLYDAWDPSKTSAYNLYQNDTQLVYAPNIDTSNVTDMNHMFDGCNSLTYIPLLDTSKVTNMYCMFYNCNSLESVPLFDTSNVTNMTYMFNGCSKLTSVPLFDTSNVTNMTYMFSSCSKLISIPQLDTSNVTNMVSMVQHCSSLTTIPQLDASKVTNISYFLTYNGSDKLTYFGGFLNLGMQSNLIGTNDMYGIGMCKNLTHDSLMNVINNLYDRASAGYSVLTLKLHANHHALLTDEEKAIATTKGWTLS